LRTYLAKGSGYRSGETHSGFAAFLIGQFMTDFRFNVPVSFIEKGDLQGNKRRIIQGICSTDDMDSDQETLLQEGLDFTPFLTKGWFNDNHASATGGAVGVPSVAEIRRLPNGRKGWYVEGELLSNKRADEIWDLAQSLERSETNRRLGFSVEGSIVERDPRNPKKVRKAVVREVAVTRCPKNHFTTLTAFAKSLSAGTGPAPVNEPVTGEGAAAVLAPEALEAEKKKKKKKKQLTKAQAIDALCKSDSRMTKKVAEQIVDYTIQRRAEED
jgi:hypothetical protein